MQNISWHDIDEACQSLADRIKKDGKIFEAIVGIPRGGLIIAVKMSHLLDIKMYPGIPQFRRNPILLCDDICDTGLTMEQGLGENIVTLALHKNINSEFVPDYYFEETTEWIKYPWETENTSKADYKENK